MIEIGDKVTHAVHEVGTVINTYNNGSICAVDFKGVTKRIETANLQKGANTYKAKTSDTDNVAKIELEIAKIKGEYCTGNNDCAHGGRVVLEQLEKFIEELKTN